MDPNYLHLVAGRVRVCMVEAAQLKGKREGGYCAAVQWCECGMGWVGLAVPLKVKLQAGPSWGELKALALDEGGS